jgi:hypothetical protein
VAHRLWLRLDDIVPLAEHAVACPDHSLTRAQTLAHAPLGPALIWTGNAECDRLVSNGVPAWHDPDGSLHGAYARTWRHIATDRYGTANIDGYHTAYLPLFGDGDQPDLIDAIRAARTDERHWRRVDIDPADAHRITAHRVGFDEHRGDLVPADTRWVPADVTSDTVAGATYPALIPDGYESDSGYLLPRFDRPTVEHLVADLDTIHHNTDRTSDPMPGEYPWLRLNERYGHVLSVQEEIDNGVTSTWRRVDLVHPDAEGRYSIGAFGWPWRLAS